MAAMVGVSLCGLVAVPEEPTLEDLWNGQAVFVVDEAHQALGSAFGMHFLATTWHAGALWTYYICACPECECPEQYHACVGLALSDDGLTFTDQGVVLSLGDGGGVPGAFDNRLASFPGIWRDGSGWYLVYEGAGCSGAFPGDIGSAVSDDGVTWQRAENNAVLEHNGYGWERGNIGTPSLWKENGLWYLFYHGYNGEAGADAKCQVGVATGPVLSALTKYADNPIVATGPPGSWDCGTVGKRSIVKEGMYYYMVYEGSGYAPYGTASWSSGLARSTDLVHWTKWSGNPILPRTDSGMGYDGPEWVHTSDGAWHIYYRAASPGSATGRATLFGDCDGNGIPDVQEGGGDVVYVDRDAVGCENGSEAFPYDRIEEGTSTVNERGVVRIAAGDYREGVCLTRALRLEATGGVVRILGPPADPSPKRR